MMSKRILFYTMLLLVFLLFLSSCELFWGQEAPAMTTTATTTTAVTTLPAYPPRAGDIKRADGIVIDGVLDSAYQGSVSIGTRYQDPAYTSDADLIIDPTEAIAMKTIFLGNGVAERPGTSFTLHLLWGIEEGAPYLYIAAVIHDESIKERSDGYMAQPNPWLTDAIEISYHLGGEDIPTIPHGEDTYPTYHNVLVDARKKLPTDHTAAAPNHTAVAAQRSFYFDRIESATARPDESTYVVEVKLPAYTETHTGKPGADLTRQGGEPLGVGDLVCICIELLDLTYLPDGYDNTLPEGNKYKDDWSYSPEGTWAPFENALMPYMYCAGNRNTAYLGTEGAGPAAFRLSGEWAE